MGRLRGVRLPAEWVDRAEVFLGDAERHLAEGHFWLTCFESHQAAELYLKSLIVAVTGFHPYTHDLAELLEALKRVGFTAGEEVVNASEILTPHYTLSLYPGERAVSYSRERAERCLKSAKSIISWVKEVADPCELGLRLLREAARRVAEWQEAFEQYVEEVRRSGLVKELYLIGSRARGEHSPSSDFDLLAVVSGGVDPLEVAEKLRMLKKRSFPLDLVVLTEEEVEDPIYSEMLRGRKKLL